MLYLFFSGKKRFAMTSWNCGLAHNKIHFHLTHNSYWCHKAELLHKHNHYHNAHLEIITFQWIYFIQHKILCFKATQITCRTVEVITANTYLITRTQILPYHVSRFSCTHNLMNSLLFWHLKYDKLVQKIHDVKS